VLNLAINARDAMEVGGTLSVETANVLLGLPWAPEEPPAGEYVSVRVVDSGTGMPEGVRQKVFEPFFTTKEVGKGSGLGLSQVLGFAQQSGGGVAIESSVGEGTAVSIYLPRTDRRPESATAGLALHTTDRCSGASILLVDDDNDVREVTAMMLRDLGYHVHEAGSGGAALELLESDTGIDLLLVDYAMPGMSGADVVRRVRSLRPLLPTVFITGYADHGSVAEIGEDHIIGKPFQLDELARKVGAALAQAGSEQR
jgi:CheY-like chemotaxis protein